MSNTKWAVPIVTMKETERQRTKRDLRHLDKKGDIMFHCKKCGLVYKKATFMFNQYRNNCKEEFYPQGVIPTYGLEKKPCQKCLSKETNA